MDHQVSSQISFSCWKNFLRLLPHFSFDQTHIIRISILHKIITAIPHIHCIVSSISIPLYPPPLFLIPFPSSSPSLSRQYQYLKRGCHFNFRFIRSATNFGEERERKADDDANERNVHQRSFSLTSSRLLSRFKPRKSITLSFSDYPSPASIDQK